VLPLTPAQPAIPAIATTQQASDTIIGNLRCRSAAMRMSRDGPPHMF
jgi:hypothetical protein